MVKKGMGSAGDMFMILKGSSFQLENHSMTEPCSITVTIIPVNANDADLNTNAADVEEVTGQFEHYEDDGLQQGGGFNSLFDGRTKLETISGSFDTAMRVASHHGRVLIVCIEDDSLPSFHFNNDVLCNESVQVEFQDLVFLWQQVRHL
jgi:hypothetical protein